jgi:hypothetical protein
MRGECWRLQFAIASTIARSGTVSFRDCHCHCPHRPSISGQAGESFLSRRIDVDPDVLYHCLSRFGWETPCCSCWVACFFKSHGHVLPVLPPFFPQALPHLLHAPVLQQLSHYLRSTIMSPALPMLLVLLWAGIASVVCQPCMVTIARNFTTYDCSSGSLAAIPTGIPVNTAWL